MEGSENLYLLEGVVSRPNIKLGEIRESITHNLKEIIMIRNDVYLITDNLINSDKLRIISFGNLFFGEGA
jgi:hypothetical protein